MRLVVVGSALALLALAGAVLAGPAMATPGGSTERVSVSSGGRQANSESDDPAVSADGRYVAFDSIASNLVPGDTNAQSDVFVRDAVAGTTSRVSVGPGGKQADSDSFAPSVSADGRYVAFWSEADNLVPGDTNGWEDVFVRDRVAGTTSRVSVGPGGAQADAGSGVSSISADGRYVAFDSDAHNLVPGDTNGILDIFVRDRVAGTTSRVSVGPGGTQADAASYGPAISADGRYVAFETDADNLVPRDTNLFSDVFVRDRVAGTTSRVSVGPGGTQADGDSGVWSISADGRYVAFGSVADNLVPGDTNGRGDVFVRDQVAGTTSRVSVGPGGSQADGDSAAPSISADGRYVAFESYASNLVSGDTNGWEDVFVRDRVAGTTSRVSVRAGGSQANGLSYQQAISADGRHVAFGSFADDLVPGDTNRSFDVFVRDVTGAPPPSDGLFAILRGAAVVPGPGDPDGSGAAILSLAPASGTVCGRVSTSGITAPTAVGIYRAVAGTAGPRVADLTQMVTAGKRCVRGLPGTILQAIYGRPGTYYVQVSTVDHPAGALRGQLRR